MVLNFRKDDDYENILRHVYTEAIWADKLILVSGMRLRFSKIRVVDFGCTNCPDNNLVDGLGDVLRAPHSFKSCTSS